MADENVIIEANEQNVGEYDPNPYDNVTVEEALKQLFNRFTPRTVRQAIFTMAENNKPATLIEKTITENDTYNASDDNADGYSKVTVDVSGGGGGGETFDVIITMDETTHKYTTNKTFSETASAIDNDILVKFWLPQVSTYAYGYFVARENGVSDIVMIYLPIYYSNTIIALRWDSDETIKNVYLDERDAN
jgi:hypothetical protein